MDNFDLEKPLARKESVKRTNSGTSSSKATVTETKLSDCMKKLFSDSIPNVIYLLSFYVISSMNMIYAAKNNDEETAKDILAGIGVAGTWINISSFLIISSLNIGMSTLAAQAYGSKNYELVGLYLHRSIILRILNLIPSVFLLIFCEGFLLHLGISESAVGLAGTYCRVCIPSIFLFAINDSLKSYISAHNIFRPILYMQVALVGVHFVLLEVFIRGFDMQITGVALAFFLSQFAGFLMYIAYLWYYNPTEETLFWFKPESFQNLWLQFKQEAMLGVFMYLEWIGYEIILVMSGSLGDLELRAMIICYNLLTILDMAGTGLGVTVTTYVASTMGEGNSDRVKKYIKASALLTLMYIVLISCVLIFASKPLARIYTGDEETVLLTAKLLGFYGIFFFFDLSQMMIVAILKGTGQEHVGSQLYLFSVFAIGLPSAYILAFILNLGALGLYAGMLLGFAVMNVLCLRVLRNMDLDGQVSAIKQRIAELSTVGDELRSVELKTYNELADN